MATVKFDDGVVIDFDGEPTQADIEEAYNQAKGIRRTPNTAMDNTNPVGLPGFNRTQEVVANRPSQWQGLLDYAGRLQQHPFKTLADPMENLLRLPMAAFGGLAKSVESPIANLAMLAQQGNLSIPNAGQAISQGITGKRPGELGDLPRNVGLPEPVASTLGLLGMTGLGNLATTGKLGGIIKQGENIAVSKGKGIIEKGKQGISNIKNAKTERIRIQNEYGNSNAVLVDKVKTSLGEKIKQADIAYKTAVDKFKGKSINSQEFFQTLQKGLRDKGYIDLTGNPTSRFKSGLDPVYDKLTNLYLDLRNVPTASGKRVIGQVMSKEDFSTYRDALSNMLKEKPSDILVAKSRNALYNSAEKSGMKGIKVARDLEKESYKIQDRFLNRNTGDLKITESKLAKIGNKNTPLSKQELDQIRELERYINQPIIKEANAINKINRSMKRMEDIKKYLIGAGAGVAGGTILGGLGKKVINNP